MNKLKKLGKLIRMLCDCIVIAVRIKWLDLKANRLIRKGRYTNSAALDEVYNKQLELSTEGMFICLIAEQLMKELKRA